MVQEYFGNQEILQQLKTGFLCSRKFPASVVLPAYDWAIEQTRANNCVISGFHSGIEKDVLKYLLMGSQPIIVVLARGLMKRVNPKLKPVLDNGRLLFITPFDKNVTRITKETALIRNKLVIELADNITVAHAKPGGSLAELLTITQKYISFL